MRQELAALMIAAVLGGCAGEIHEPILISAIAPSKQSSGQDRGEHSITSRLQLMATAQGLVAFDNRDRIEPALAERWTVTDDGLSYIFRIAKGDWSSGRPVTSVDVANSLRSTIAARRHRALRPFFRNIAAIIPMTAYVVEIRLKRPEPDFLQLLAQPEMAVTRKGHGSGPYALHSRRDGVSRFRLISESLESALPDASRDIRLITENVSTGIARFATGQSGQLAGGTFNDVLLVGASNVPTARFRLDPAYGLFGLALISKKGFLADRNARLALSIAIDRNRLVQYFGLQDWRPALSILPTQLDSSSAPAAMQAIQQDLADRRAEARFLLSRTPVEDRKVTIALPSTSGGRLLFALIRADWREIGVETIRVEPGRVADFRLIDEVAPISSGVWYLNRLSCAQGHVCDEAAESAIEAINQAPDLQSRSARIAAADIAMTSAQIWIPLALPLRWSLVSPDLSGWLESAFSNHSLRQLRPLDD
jgi:oligopeptide transport system substrate-binding protein